MIYVGTAAWSIPKIAEEHFPIVGSHLERYSLRLDAVEINSTFYRDHTEKSYRKWSNATPEYFRFSVKLNKRFTHDCNLDINEFDLIENLTTISALGDKWGALLLQFPKKIEFDFIKMKFFYQVIRKVFSGPIAIEARNLSWMSSSSLELLNLFNISKVTADPEKCPFDHDSQIKYYRLHGSPETYRSNYDEEYLNNLYEEMRNAETDIWCIFDNTIFGHATKNAVMIKDMGASYERHQRLYDNWNEHLYTLNEY